MRRSPVLMGKRFPLRLLYFELPRGLESEPKVIDLEIQTRTWQCNQKRVFSLVLRANGRAREQILVLSQSAQVLACRHEVVGIDDVRQIAHVSCCSEILSLVVHAQIQILWFVATTILHVDPETWTHDLGRFLAHTVEEVAD